MALAALVVVAAGLLAAADAPLERTYWRATRVAQSRVDDRSGARAPYLVLDAGRVSGADGCNRISGRYTVRGDRIQFVLIAATRMACEGTAAVERGVHRSLADARRWRIVGSVLELYDGRNARLARFEARSSQ